MVPHCALVRALEIRDKSNLQLRIHTQNAELRYDFNENFGKGTSREEQS